MPRTPRKALGFDRTGGDDAIPPGAYDDCAPRLNRCREDWQAAQLHPETADGG
jgi:hypothetical protein